MDGRGHHEPTREHESATKIRMRAADEREAEDDGRRRGEDRAGARQLSCARRGLHP